MGKEPAPPPRGDSAGRGELPVLGMLGAGAAQASPTAAPELISPASSSYTASPLTIAYRLPEAASTVELTILGEDEFKAVIALTGAEAREAGEHTVSFDTHDVDATSGIENHTGTTEFPDGAYSIDLDYENTSGGGLNGADATDVHVVTATAAPSLTAPADGSEASGPFTIEYSLPEAAASGTVALRLEGESSGASVIALKGGLAGAHAVTIDPADPLDAPEVASGPSRLPSDKYKLTLSYQDFLGNPAASSSAVEFTLERKCAPGYYSAPYGEAPCDAAETGHYASGPGATEETECRAGAYSADIGDASCLPSPAGFYAPAGSVSAIPCSVGTHDPHASSTSPAACEEDPPGSYSLAGAAEATLCGPGRFAASWGSFECVLAEPGHYVQGHGASSQLPCPAGSYSSVTGAASCRLAPVGSYALEGAVEPTPCPAGTEANSEGQSKCTPMTLAPGGSGSTTSSLTLPLTQAAPAPGPATVAPRVSRLRIDRRSFPQKALAAGSAHGPAVSYLLSARAALRYTLYKSLTSHPLAGCQRSGARCRTIASSSVAALRAGPHTASLASILRQAAGADAKSASQRKLAPGVYVLTVEVLGAQGASPQPASVRFAVL